jgi:hypothetical protein
MNNPTLTGIDLSQQAYIDDAIKFLRVCQPKDRPYYGCFSGGKDSCVIKELANRGGVNVVWHYNVTTIDPPELVHFIRREHPDVIFDRPECNFFTYAIRHKKGFPTRRMRWCCEHFKERKSTRGSFLILGVRAAESPRRAKAWSAVTHHDKTGVAEFARWPGFERKWKQLFRDTWAMRVGRLQRNGEIWFGERYFKNWEEMWEWWLSDEPLPKDKCQGLIELFV